MMPITIFLYLIIELIFVSWEDVKTEKISNLWSILNIISFVILLWVIPELYTVSLSLLFYPLIFLIIGFILFLLNIMGGGDSKFLSTFFLVVPHVLHDLMFESLLLSTIVIAGFLFITNMIKNYKKIFHNLRMKNLKEVKSFFGTKFSYAPVILLAWLWLGWNIKIISF